VTRRHLLLAGGGHAHVHVLQALSTQRLPEDVQVSLVTPFTRQMYSGMVPGLVAGHYGEDQCVIPLRPLAEAAGVRFIDDRLVALDAGSRRVRLAGGESLAYDWLSLDTGPVMDRRALPGADAHAWFVRPIEHFVQDLAPLWARAGDAARAGRGGLQLLVVGGGAAGVELALALDWRLRGQGAGAVHRLGLVAGADEPLAGFPAAARRRARQALADRGIEVHQAVASAVDAGGVQLADGRRLACDQVLMAIGASAPPWLEASGLALDARGFVATGPTLQSCSHPTVFAAGDVATRIDRPHPKSGVYAVRAGPPLAANLRAAVADQPMRSYKPQRRTLYLLSLGRQRAIGAWGPLVVEGDWVWRWKDRIDRRFIARYGGEAGEAG